MNAAMSNDTGLVKFARDCEDELCSIDYAAKNYDFVHVSYSGVCDAARGCVVGLLSNSPRCEVQSACMAGGWDAGRARRSAPVGDGQDFWGISYILH